MLHKSVLLSCLLLLLFSTQAQLQEDFSDGELLNNPTWLGEINLFQVNANLELQSNGPAASEVLHVSTSSTDIGETEWRLKLDYAFAPSTSNQIRIYLVSDQADLEGPLNGYYVGVGESGSNDSYDLFRQDGSTSTKIIDGIDGNAGSGLSGFVKVLRDSQGNWSLWSDPAAINNFQQEGSIQDLTYTSTSFFGIYVKHSSTRAQSFFFDDIYIGPEIVDTDPPQPLNVSVLSLDELSVAFSEGIDPSTATDPSNYSLDQALGNPVSAAIDPNDSRIVNLSFGNAFANNTNYLLTISGIADLSGNVMPQAVDLPFSYIVPEIPSRGDVIFNEIMPDPTPAIGLPESEFVEFYNRSNKVFNLLNWTLSNGTTTGSLPDYILSPNEYVVFCRASDTALFPFPVQGLSTWPAQVNGGDELTLRADNGSLVDQLNYQSSWYGDPDKDDGGYSLERINPNPTSCPQIANWTVSVAASGGTPAFPNSVFNDQPETTAPILTGVNVLANNQIVLSFNEAMDSLLLADLAAYNLQPILGTPDLAQPLGPDFLSVLLSFTDTLVTGQTYDLSVANVADCSGNLLQSPAQISVLRGRPAFPLSLVITEFIADFDPSFGLPAAEYVELHNPTDLAIDLSGLSFTDGGVIGSVSSGVIAAGGYAILVDEADSALFSPFGQVIALSSMPSLNNASDELFLYSATGELIDFVFYENAWYGESDKGDGGFSLERIDPRPSGCNNPANWLPSTANIGGTPGQANSVLGTFDDLTLATVETILLPEPNRIVLRFSEQMDLLALENTLNYSLSEGIGEPLLATTTQPYLREVSLLLDQDLQSNIVYELTLNHSDCAGNVGDTVILLGLPVPITEGDILLNEILFNPFTGGSDFVEIINVSTNILDLAELQIGEGLPDTDSIFNTDVVSDQSIPFLPGQILCLTKDVAFQKLSYQTPVNANFWQMAGFPTYDDGEGEVVLLRRDGLVLDRFAYLDDYHYPTLVDDDGVSLERLSTTVPTQEISNWHSAASTVNYATPGYENSQFVPDAGAEDFVSLEPQTFSPNDDGEDDVIAIRYQFPFNGANARVQVFDTRGRLIKELQPNLLLSPDEGTFFWDGTDNKNTKADIGMYVIAIEITNQQNGVREVYRRVCVLADRL
ncbi:MAG: lamin tail domain-containing protein [Bacteroidota bacterium]